MLSLTTPLCVAAAQTPSAPGNLQRNLQMHLACVRAAARRGVQLLQFPELSLIGYEPAHVAQHVLTASHAVLVALLQAAQNHGMALVVGAPVEPVEQGALPAIGAWLLKPDGTLALYRKRHLHGSEETFASKGADDAQVHLVAGEPTALAVCADITLSEHAQAARGAGAALYAAGVLISENAYPAESALLESYARTHDMAVLMANFSGSSGGYVSAGRSAFWAPGGRCVAAAQDDAPCIVWAARGDSGWSGGVQSLSETA